MEFFDEGYRSDFKGSSLFRKKDIFDLKVKTKFFKEGIFKGTFYYDGYYMRSETYIELLFRCSRLRAGLEQFRHINEDIPCLDCRDIGRTIRRLEGHASCMGGGVNENRGYYSYFAKWLIMKPLKYARERLYNNINPSLVVFRSSYLTKPKEKDYPLPCICDVWDMIDVYHQVFYKLFQYRIRDKGLGDKVRRDNVYKYTHKLENYLIENVGDYILPLPYKSIDEVIKPFEDRATDIITKYYRNHRANYSLLFVYQAAIVKVIAILLKFKASIRYSNTKDFFYTTKEAVKRCIKDLEDYERYTLPKNSREYFDKTQIGLSARYAIDMLKKWNHTQRRFQTNFEELVNQDGRIYIPSQDYISLSYYGREFTTIEKECKALESNIVRNPYFRLIPFQGLESLVCQVYRINQLTHQNEGKAYDETAKLYSEKWNESNK